MNIEYDATETNLDIHTVPKRISVNGEADFETAVAATGFGKFNFFLLIAILACTCSQIFDAHNMSYVLPVAQCDLSLTLEDKGVLNSVAFAGMICSGFFWGFLSDKFGRRKIMLYGYSLHWCCMILASLSQNVSMLIVAKFFAGAIVNGPTSAAISLLSEFHTSKYRAKIQLARGMTVTIATILLPLLSWTILQRELNFKIFNILEIHSWNVFFLVCSVAPLTAGILLSLSPESPKFLMSMGKNEEALKVFKKIYRLNTGNSEDTFPVKYLIDETVSNVSVKNSISQSGCSQKLNVFSSVKALFVPPHVSRLLLACTNSLVVMMSTNTLKFWQPQLLQAVNDYQYLNNGSSGSMCDMLEVIVPKNTSSVCTVNLDNTSVYINSLIINSFQLVAFVVVGTLVGWTGKKTIMIMGAVIAAISAASLYFGQNSTTLVVLFAVFMSVTGLCQNVGDTQTLEMFPTTFRTTAIALHLASSRIGTLAGNLVFPSLLIAGCLPPFLFISLSIFSSAILTTFLPNTENKALQ